MAYDFVYTDQLEKACRKTLGSNLKEYEVEVRQNVLENKNTYNAIKERYDGLKTGFNNIVDLAKFGIDSIDILKTVVRYSSLSYKMGGQQAYSDFSIKKDFSTFKAIDDINEYSYNATSSVTGLYRKLVISIATSSIKNGKSFEEFLFAFDNYHDFSKADALKFGELPSKSNILQNLGTRLVSIWNTIGRLTGYSRTKVVTALQYRTRQDERVSSICAPWHGRVLNFNEAVGLIPQHRNCRCTLVPFR